MSIRVFIFIVFLSVLLLLEASAMHMQQGADSIAMSLRNNKNNKKNTSKENKNKKREEKKKESSSNSKEKKSFQRKQENQTKEVVSANTSEDVDKLATREADELMFLHYGMRMAGALIFPSYTTIPGGKVTQGKLGGGWSLGVTFSIPFTKVPNKWRLQPEINLGFGMQPKISFVPSEDAMRSQYNFSYYYFQFPFLVKYNWLEKLHFYVGPSIYALLDVVYDGGISLDKAVNNFNVGLTAGVQYLISNRISLEMRYNHQFLQAYSPQKAVAPFTNASFIPRNVEIGLAYRFKSSQKVTVVSNNLAEDLYIEGDILNLSKSIDPNEDLDGDGIPYYKDVCPNEPGSAWNNGCPGDDDRDGVPNSQDSCIKVPGVVNNFGCPINDKDRDGVIDTYDKCPNEKGVASNKGCPLGVEPLVSEALKDKTNDPLSLLRHMSDTDEKQMFKLLSHLSFDKNTTNLTEEGKKALDSLARFIVTRPQLSFRLFAYSKSVHSQQQNKSMSLRRVRAIKKYLVVLGVASDRIGVEGDEDLFSLDKASHTIRTVIRASVQRILSSDKKVIPSIQGKTSDVVNNKVTSLNKPKDIIKEKGVPIVKSDSDSTKKSADTMDLTKKLTLLVARMEGIAKTANRNLSFITNTTKFNKGSLTVSTATEIGNLLKEYQDIKFIVHISYRSGDKNERKNSKIALDRVEKIRDLLGKKGVDKERIDVNTKGVSAHAAKDVKLTYSFERGGK